jgi:hypothetical protein
MLQILDGLGTSKYLDTLGSGDNSIPFQTGHVTRSEIAIYRGTVFSLSASLSLANNATSSLLFKTPPNRIVNIISLHLETSSGPIQVEFSEDGLVSANGTAAPIFIKNRSASNGSLVTGFLAPTVTSYGTVIMYRVACYPSSDAVSEVDAWLLKPSTNYLLKFVNASGSASVMKPAIIWSEE